MPPDDRQRSDYARHALYRHRQIARQWGLFALVVALIIGALTAPNTTLLVAALLVVFGALGLAVSFGLRLIGRLF
jgi:hypothetical protein